MNTAMAASEDGWTAHVQCSWGGIIHLSCFCTCPLLLFGLACQCNCPPPHPFHWTMLSPLHQLAMIFIFLLILLLMTVLTSNRSPGTSWEQQWAMADKLLESATDDINRACLLASRSKVSGAWLHAFLLSAKDVRKWRLKLNKWDQIVWPKMKCIMKILHLLYHFSSMHLVKADVKLHLS